MAPEEIQQALTLNVWVCYSLAWGEANILHFAKLPGNHNLNSNKLHVIQLPVK